MSKTEGGDGGVILNIAGLYGLKPLSPAPTLSACQHAIVGLSRSCGDVRNSKPTGVRVVTLCPGITDTTFIQNAEKRAYNEHLSKQLAQVLCKSKRQKADVCGQAALYVLKYSPSGGVWVVEGSKLYSCNIPSWKSYSALQSQLM